MKWPANLSDLSMDRLVDRLGRIPDRKRWGMEALAFVLIALAYLGIFARANVDTLDALTAQLVKSEQSLQEKRNFASNFASYEKELAQNRERLASARTMLPNEAEIAPFLATLGGLAGALDVSIERIEPAQEVPREFYAETSLKVQVRGPFHQIAMLIDRLGSQPRIVNVTNVSFGEPKTENAKIAVTSQFEVKLFRFLSDEQIAATDAKAPKP